MFTLLFLLSCDDTRSNEFIEEKSSPISSMLQFIIDTKSKKIIDEPKIPATLIITDSTDTLYNGHIGIELRGSTSQIFFDKKSYGVETWDQNGNDIDIALAGFPAEEDWIFHGPFSDKSLIRNALIYDLSNKIGQYASRTRFFEMKLNGEFQGTYLLMEKIKRDKNRVDIEKLESNDNDPNLISGGYIIKIDKTTGESTSHGDYNEKISFYSKYDPNGEEGKDKKIFFLYDVPSPEKISKEQKIYIQSYINSFEEALLSNDFSDPKTGYRQFIDVDSFVDFFLLNELSHNPDAYRLSTYMHKKRNGKLKMGPIWDFNIAFGNVNYCKGEDVNNWIFKYNDYCPDDFWLVPFWWSKLLNDPYFANIIKSRWQGLRQNELSDKLIFGKIDLLISELETSDAIKRNFERWPILGQWIWPNSYVGTTYESEINYLKNWLSQRLTWMDSNIPSL
tara:strand:- start:462 stop:1808 length:1347 start_codon:yes stop_codon:yes gene_type:complete